jgi:hypothetical protein
VGASFVNESASSVGQAPLLLNDSMYAIASQELEGDGQAAPSPAAHTSSASATRRRARSVRREERAAIPRMPSPTQEEKMSAL